MDARDITDVKMLEEKVQKYIQKDKFDINKVYYIIPVATFILLATLQPSFVKEKNVIKSIEIEKISPKKFVYAWVISTCIFMGAFAYWKSKNTLFSN